ncbi:hypothetical protein R5R35_006436 [Gryllus longicercus]|uniref:Uncharacterized protein n=1 Tax=Gryllus longicercus TaxID=2509291 RepID=A0AAN9W001_9ORTH|nr:Uncharacterized protein GBIM_14592 [Gryllus bimaculatus]
MPQGKLKVKAKGAAPKSKKKATKGPAVTKRGNRPIQPKKKQQKEAQKLNKVVTKTVNQAMEEELRARALDGRKSLTNKKQATPKKAAAKKSKK